jgi:hypothetical protein
MAEEYMEEGNEIGKNLMVLQERRKSMKKDGTTITLTDRECAVLCAILGGCITGNVTGPRGTTSDICARLGGWDDKLHAQLLGENHGIIHLPEHWPDEKGIESWKKEFYPVPADQVKGLRAGLEHSIKKFKGCRGENLSKHHVELVWQSGRAPEVREDYRNCFTLNGTVCALCCVFPRCVGCPLVSCDGRTPYVYFCDIGDPDPLIKKLEELLVLYDKGLLKDLSQDVVFKGWDIGRV